MSLFYLLLQEREQGPYTIEALAKLKIKSNTQLRHEGSTTWQSASSIPELHSLIHHSAAPTPQPIANPVFHELGNLFEAKKAKGRSLGIVIMLVFILFLLIIGIVNHRNFKKREELYELEMTALENRLQHYQEIEEIRKIQDQQQEAARAVAEQQLKQIAISESHKAEAASRSAALAELQKEYKTALYNRHVEELVYKDVKRFRLLRIGSEKRRQIEKQERRIAAWQQEADRLKKEIDAYGNLEMELGASFKNY